MKLLKDIAIEIVLLALVGSFFGLVGWLLWTLGEWVFSLDGALLWAAGGIYLFGLLAIGSFLGALIRGEL